MKNVLEMKRKIKCIRYFLTVVCVLALTLITRLRKAIPEIQQTVPSTSEYMGDVKKFVSVEIMQGDTLWSIAEDHKTGNYTTRALIEEIKYTNGLSGDRIMAGRYLIVPYYD